MEKSKEIASSRPGFEWLYPDLLTKADLVKTLEQRYIKEGDLKQLDKDELVVLYNKYIIPLPQRKYRLNRRGRDMTVKQVKMAKKRRAVITVEDNPPPEKRRSTGKLMSSFEQSVPVGDRLKPPPSQIDFSKKKIKLGGSVKSSSESVTPMSSSLNKLKLTKSDSSKDEKSENSPKKIKLNNKTAEDSKVDDSVRSRTDKHEQHDKVNSEVRKSNKTGEKMDTSEKGTDGKTETKKKVIKISWP